ncbi:MAG: hypothetical protein KBD01_06165 [Acidobacteria bacterium]|nr:hypothetical protein [Acidobacteriota bacterium]
MSKPSRVVVVSFSDLARDPRVNRQLRFLAERYDVVAAGYGDPGLDGVTYVPLERRPKGQVGHLVAALRLATRRDDAYYSARADVTAARAAAARLAGGDLYVANDLETLPVVLDVAAGAPVLFDAHEYAPREFEDSAVFRLLLRRYREALCRRFMPRAAAVTTVCESIARRYEAETGVRCVVVWNAPDFEDLAPGDAMPGGALRLVHHGAAHPGRRIETMIEGARAAGPHVTLDLYLVSTSAGSIERLQRVAAGDPRVRFLPAVPMRELPRRLNGYDAGVFVLAPANYNWEVALPNKFFEYVQARLAQVIGPSPEMVRLLRENDLGLVTDDFSPAALARTLAALTPDAVARFKRNAHAAARRLSADTVRTQLHRLAERLLAGARGR